MIRFDELVIRYFQFLTVHYGYLCVESGPGHVEYRSDSVVIGFVYDHLRSYELDAYFGLLSDTEVREDMSFNLGEVLRYFEVSEATKYSCFQGGGAETIEPYLSEVASLLKAHATAVLTGEESVFLALEQQQEQEGDEYTRQLDLLGARAQAEKAWAEKEYAKYIQALEGYEKDLTASEKERLIYAQKQ